MSLRDGLITRLIARVRALFPRDWEGHPGNRFRRTTQRISEFAEKHRLTPQELLDEGVELGRAKLRGVATHEFSQATKNFADAEKAKIEAELQRRSLQSDVEKREAEGHKARVDARLAELNLIRAEVDLLKTLQEIGVVLHRDMNGNLTALPLPPSCDLMELVEGSTREAAVSKLSEVLNSPATEMQMSERCHSALRRAGVQTVGEPVQKTENELLRTKNFGRKSLNEVKEVLAIMGLSLGMRIDAQGRLVAPPLTPEDLSGAQRDGHNNIGM